MIVCVSQCNLNQSMNHCAATESLARNPTRATWCVPQDRAMSTAADPPPPSAATGAVLPTGL